MGDGVVVVNVSLMQVGGGRIIVDTGGGWSCHH